MNCLRQSFANVLSQNMKLLSVCRDRNSEFQLFEQRKDEGWVSINADVLKDSQLAPLADCRLDQSASIGSGCPMFVRATKTGIR